jgi:hypothetical protein
MFNSNMNGKGMKPGKVSKLELVRKAALLLLLLSATAYCSFHQYRSAVLVLYLVQVVVLLLWLAVFFTIFVERKPRPFRAGRNRN